jgi:hypothetical protein
MGRSIINEKPPPNLPEGRRIKDLKDLKEQRKKRKRTEKQKRKILFIR